MRRRMRQAMILLLLALLSACGTTRKANEGWYRIGDEGGTLVEVYDREVSGAQLDSIMRADTLVRSLNRWVSTTVGPDNDGGMVTEYTYVKGLRTRDTYVVYELEDRYRITLRKTIFD